MYRMYAVGKDLRVETSCSLFIMNSCVLFKNCLSADSTLVWSSFAIVAAEADIQGWIRNGLNDLNIPDDDVRGYEEQKLEDPAM